MIEASTGLWDMFIRFLSRIKGTLEKCVREKNSSVWAFQTVSVARKAFFLSHIYRIQLDTVSSLPFFDRELKSVEFLHNFLREKLLTSKLTFLLISFVFTWAAVGFRLSADLSGLSLDLCC